MNSINDVIQKLYYNLINMISNNFEESDKREIQVEYMKILNNRYSELAINTTEYEKLYEKLFKLEYNEWSNLSLDMKKHVLLKDSALDEIINIASAAFNFAKERLNKNILISTEIAEQYISRLSELYDSVKDYNKQLANWHISEGTLDLKYSSGQTENMSMRIGHIK